MFFGIDTQIMVDAAMNLPTVDYIAQKSSGQEIGVSSVVYGEAYGILINVKNYTCDMARDKLRTTISMINGKQEEYNSAVLAFEADRILKSHKEMKPNEKDHQILAHYKSLGIRKIFCRDRLFQIVITKEGLEYVHVPSADKINEEKYRNLFR